MCHSNVQISNDTVYSYLRKFEVAFVFENEHNYEKWWIGLQQKLHTNNNSISSFYQFDVDIYPHQISIFSLVYLWILTCFTHMQSIDFIWNIIKREMEQVFLGYQNFKKDRILAPIFCHNIFLMMLWSCVNIFVFFTNRSQSQTRNKGIILRKKNV